MAHSPRLLVLLILVCYCQLEGVDSHGRMLQPPGRSTMWRKGFGTPENYNDNELNCGGYSIQWFYNKGKCGVCGDRWDGERDNEAGGKYATKTIVKRFAERSTITVVIELTAIHLGYFTFSICPLKKDEDYVTEECLRLYPLRLADREGYKYRVKGPSPYVINLVLPTELSCERCVLRWYYRAGNRWGCEGKLCGLGNGPQEEFYACADVMVSDRMLAAPVHPSPTTSTPEQTTTDAMTTKIQTAAFTTKAVTIPTKPRSDIICTSSGYFAHVTTMDIWCITNCALNFCPSSHCRCTSGKPAALITGKFCLAVTPWVGDSYMDRWCGDNCPEGHCPDLWCKCS